MLSITSKLPLLGALTLASSLFISTDARATSASEGSAGGVHELVYAAMFGHSPEAGDGLFFDFTPQEPGSYSGFDAEGAWFSAEFSELTPLDLEGAAFLEQLTDEQLAALRDVSSMQAAFGRVRNEHSGHEIAGVLIERHTSQGPRTELRCAAFQADLAFVLEADPSEVFPACGEGGSFVVPVYEIPEDCPCFDDLCWEWYEQDMADAYDAFREATEAADALRAELAQEYQMAMDALTSIVGDYMGQLQQILRHFGATADGVSTGAMLNTLESNFNAEVGALVELMQGSIDEIRSQYNDAMSAATSAYQAAGQSAYLSLLECLELFCLEFGEPECQPVLKGWYTISWTCSGGLSMTWTHA